MLNPDAFAKLLKWLLEYRKRNRQSKFEDESLHEVSEEELAGEEYEKIREKLITYFSRKRCLTPLELADETITRVADRIADDETIMISEPEPARFFYNTARYVFFEYLRESGKELPISEEFPPSQHPSVDPIELEEREKERLKQERCIECLERCKAKLPPGNWDMIIGYYQGETSEKIKNRKSLAEKFNLTPNALSIRAHRIRRKLEDCLNGCFNDIVGMFA